MKTLGPSFTELAMGIGTASLRASRSLPGDVEASAMEKVVLITGASSGIGKLTALHFAQQGWKVAATMRTPEVAVKEWAPQSPNFLCLPLDVTDENSIEVAVRATQDQLGPIGALVNNAGYGMLGPFEASTAEQVERQFRTNVFGLMNVTRAVLAGMRQQGEGVVVNISSVGGRV